MIAKKRIAASLLAAFFVCFCVMPFNILAVTDVMAKSEPVQQIYSKLSNRTEEFSIEIDDKPTEKIAADMFSAASSLSLSVLHSIGSYSYSTKGSEIKYTVKYTAQNGYEYAFAPNYDEVGIIVSRVISKRKPGINIYVEDPLYYNDIKYVLAKADEIYNRYKAETGDQYSAYLVSEIMYGVANVSFKKGGFFITYAFKYNETPKQTAEVKKVAGQVVSSLDEDMSIPKKIEYINKWIKENTSYKETGRNSDYTAYGLIRDKTAVCQGYSLMTYELMNAAGILCGIVTGTAKDPVTGREGLHMWNVVCVDGEWFHLDTTWNDAYSDSDPYFMLTDSQIEADHYFDKEIFNPISYEKALANLWNKEESEVVFNIGSPNMCIGDYTAEIDPGRNTVPIIIDNRTLLPIRTLIESLGGQVVWDGANSHIVINYHEYVLDMWLNDNIALVNGMEVIMDVPVTISNGRSMVPLRFVAEMLGMGVEWIDTNQRIEITPY